ncbi:Ubiquitin carboxyl-terminal hydrolase 34 [Amphibalanus amphitrite]|uniref:Ubiquitin carboxyl-terminal hydrolase 34 n=1 Tax=Amphibalanus amphitrite TaxID=1232801 RepID=A0A6A4WXZ8_AMPAM|nr:Ubiquitin carboxyl-terminal hydrolase 34 [Amphibalanus amphitrite]
MPGRRWTDPPSAEPAAAEAAEPPAGGGEAGGDGGGSAGGAEDLWQLEQVERMLHLVVKVFQPQFPPYLAYKHVLPRPESAGGGGGSGSGEQPVPYSAYCDVHDPEVSEFILRNVCYFCESGAVQAVTAAFAGQSPATLPLVLAHALLASVSNLKVWLNYRTIVQLLVPLRAAILKYMCKFSDGDLRSAASRSMSDFMWSSIKDPLDAPLSFDKDGLDLAFKFFTSSTLTMRLAGISQINNHINIFNELCNGESIVEAENVGLQLANWLIQNQMVEQLFGPNLHVEIVKQSHVVLSFLAVEGRLTNGHIELILQSAQLKHCSKQVYDILAPLIKNLEAEPVLHLYSLLQKMEPRDHTEQSLYLTSVLIKFIWSNGGTYSSVLDNVIKSLAGGDVSSSENSISMDASDDESELAAVSGARREAPPDRPEVTGSPSQPPTAGAGAGVGAELGAQNEHAESSRKRSEPGGGQMMEGRPHLPSEEARRKRLIHCPAGQLSGRDSSDDSSSAEGDGDGDGETAPRAGVKRRRRANPSPPAQRLLPAPAAAPPGLGALVSVRPPPSPSLSSQDSQLDADVFAHDKLKTSLLKTELQQFKMQQIGRDLSDDDSCSSRMSVKSEKNMADFEGEECVYEEELVQLAIQAQSQLPHHLASMASMYQARFGAVPPTLLSKARRPPPAAGSHLFARYGTETVCQPGNTLLWDLLHDDRIGELGEGMAAECEKILSNLLCYNSDRAIRKKFIEGCLQNLAQGRSVLVSLRMLPKLFASFQQFRGLDTHQITLWAEREHSMMQHFFNSLRQLSSGDAGSSDLSGLSTRQSEVQVRLHFLSTVFCSLGSPEHFRLSVEQVDTLWNCLAHDPRHSDDLFSWMLSQVRGKEQHALGMDSLRYLLTEKLPSLDPAEIGMTALNLYQQLYQLLRLAGAPLADTEAVGMDQLWKIALRANNTDVSLAAIQYLNSCYVSGREERERRFVERCMCELASAGADLGQSDESSLLRIQRGLVLLKTHLQTYRKRFAYQVRCWQLEGHGVMSHAQLVGEMAAPLRVVLQPACSSERKPITLAHNNYVAELRAEVHAFWQQQQAAAQQAAAQGQPARLGGPAGDGLSAATDPAQLRIISQGTELTPDCDDKLLTDVGFKDMQLVYISVGVSRPQRRSADGAAGADGTPTRESSPMMLLLEEKHFTQLLQLMNQLSSLRGPNGAPHTKAQVLSRRVWDILMVLPTSPQLKDGFGDLSAVTPSTLHTLLDPSIPQKLMYSLYLVASLCSGKEAKEVSDSDPESKQQTQEWRQKFIECGGLQHLYDILMSGVLQLREANHWDEWRQDCLACLLQLLLQISVVRPEGGGAAASGPATCSSSGGGASLTPEHAKKKARRQQRKWDQLTVPRLSPAMLRLMDLEAVAARLTSVLHDASLPRDPNHYKTGFWGRAQVVHYALNLLVSLCYSAPEAADAMYRFASAGGEEAGKEPYGPSCREYFGLVCRLLDSVDEPEATELRLAELAQQCARSIADRELLERRHQTAPDDGLVGLLKLCAALTRQSPAFKTSPAATQMVHELFDALFALPTPSGASPAQV